MKYATKLNPNDTREAYAAELRRCADRGETPDLYAVADYLENVGLEEIGDLEEEIETLKEDVESFRDSLEIKEKDNAALRKDLDHANDKLDELVTRFGN